MILPKVAICDDEKPIREGIRTLLEQTDRKLQINVFCSGKELLEAVAKGYSPDIVLLDIAMEDLDGMETAKRLKQSGSVILIFITGIKEAVFSAFDVGAFHYLLKPIDEEKFVTVMEKALLEVQKNTTRKQLLVKADGNYSKVMVSDILYAESDGRKVILHMQKGSLSFYEKMDELEKKLGNGFYRCHRGYLVSLAAVLAYDNTSITIKNGEKIYLAKRKYADFVYAYTNFLKE